MGRLQIRVAAKINPFLQIVGNRSDGYHDLSMVLQSIALFDRLILEALPPGKLELVCTHPEVPTDHTNLALKAALLLQQQGPDRGGVRIVLEKAIPVGAGLAGGSANAAGVLVGLNRLWQLGLSIPELQELAAQLGSDIPFCVTGGTMLAEGRGERLTPLPPLPEIPIVVCKERGVAVSTGWAYQTFRAQRCLDHPHSFAVDSLLTVLAHNPTPAAIASCLYNDLERVVLPHYPTIAALKNALQRETCLGALMSGSGSAVFALTSSLQDAQHLAEEITSQFTTIDAWATTTIGWGVEVT